jgi:hypothetical protein
MTGIRTALCSGTVEALTGREPQAREGFATGLSTLLLTRLRVLL